MLRLGTPSTTKRRGETSNEQPQIHPRRDVCNWCATRPRMDGKPYCKTCAARGRECRGCHRPMPSKYFDGDAHVCKTCASKYNRQQTTRKNNITTFGVVLLEKTCTEVAENPDSRTFLAARQGAIIMRRHCTGVDRETWYKGEPRHKHSIVATWQRQR